MSNSATLSPAMPDVLKDYRQAFDDWISALRRVRQTESEPDSNRIVAEREARKAASRYSEARDRLADAMRPGWDRAFKA